MTTYELTPEQVASVKESAKLAKVSFDDIKRTRDMGTGFKRIGYGNNGHILQFVENPTKLSETQTNADGSARRLDFAVFIDHNTGDRYQMFWSDANKLFKDVDGNHWGSYFKDEEDIAKYSVMHLTDPKPRKGQNGELLIDASAFKTKVATKINRAKRKTDQTEFFELLSDARTEAVDTLKDQYLNDNDEVDVQALMEANKVQIEFTIQFCK